MSVLAGGWPPQPQQPISIEPMRLSDLNAVFRIDKLSFPSPWLLSAYATELSNPAASYLVARIGDEIAGYGGVWVIREDAHITTLAVAPEHRGRRIGESILVALLGEALYHGGRRAELEVRATNRAAIGLYKKFGFYEAAIRRQYYTDTREDALVMWCDSVLAARSRA